MSKNTTPMMSQYKSLKAKYEGCLLFFRLGDFYEMFFEDAEIGSRELGITLTSRGSRRTKKVPMCGVPHHSADDYIRTLISKGYKVAICEQVEDPAKAKGLVKRDVVRVITPGTYWEGAEDAAANYMTAIYAGHDNTEATYAVGLCSCDLSTGEVLLAWFEQDVLGAGQSQVQGNVVDEISRLLPKECVFPKSLKGTSLLRAVVKNLPGVYTSFREDSDYDIDSYRTLFLSQWDLQGLPDAAYKALSGLLSYLEDTQMVKLSHLKKPSLYLKDAFVELDHSTRRNLELTQRLQGEFYGSLAWVLDECCTSMGSRLLKKWIQRPLRDPSMIRKRLDAVEEIHSSFALRSNLRNTLTGIRDLERLVTKITYKTCNARDLVAIASSLEKVPLLKEQISGDCPELLKQIRQNLDEIPR